MLEFIAYYIAGPLFFFLHDLGNDPVLMMKTYGVIFGFVAYLVARNQIPKAIRHYQSQRRLRRLGMR